MKMGSTMINGGLDLMVRLAKAAGESQGAKSAQFGFGTNSSKFLWRPLQLSKKNKSKNCFEILMAKEMGLDRAPWNFIFFIFTMYMWQPLVQADTMSYYVRSATRSCVITRGCKANIFRITRWQKNASYARSPSLYCYLLGTLAACNFSLARAKLYWTLCLEHFEAKAIENGGGGSYYGAGGRLSGQTGRYYYNWQLAKMKKFDSNVMANFDPFHGNWRIHLHTPYFGHDWHLKLLN